MTSSTSASSPAPGSRRPVRYWGPLALTATLALGACTATPATQQSAAAPTSAAGTAATPSPAPTPTGTSGVAPGNEPLTHDGRTVVPAPGADCARPALPELRRVLGAVADQVQPADAQASSKDGSTDVVCTFALAPAGAGQAADLGNSLLVARTAARDPAALDALGLPRLMMSPEPVPALGANAWYSVNHLTETTEYVLEVADGLTVVRVTLALPAAAAEPQDVKNKLTELARLS